MRLLLAATLATFCLLLTIGTSSAQDAAKEAAPETKISLKLKWKKGETQRYRLTQAQAGAQEVEGRPKTDTKSETVMEFSQTVKDIDDKGVVTVELVYDAIKITQDGGMVKLAWDSTKPDEGDAENPGVKPYKIMLGRKFTMKLNAGSQVIEVAGFDEVVEELLKEYEDESMKEMLRGAFESTMGNKAMLKTLGNTYKFLPGKDVAVGDTWDYQIDTPMATFGTLDVNTRIKLAAVEQGKDGQLARLTGEGTLNFTPPKKEEPKEGEGEAKPNPYLNMFDIVIENGKQTTENTFNIERGIQIKGVARQSFDMKLTMKNGGMEIKQSMTQVVTNEYLPPEEKKPGTK